MRRAQIKLPRSFRAADPTVEPCLRDHPAPRCTAENVIGAAEVGAPLLEHPLRGNVYLMENADPRNDLFQIRMNLHGVDRPEALRRYRLRR